MSNKLENWIKENTDIEVNIHFLDYMTECDYQYKYICDNLVDLIISFNELEIDILFDDHYGQYIPALFSDMLLNDYLYNDTEKTFIRSYADKKDNKEKQVVISGIDIKDIKLLADRDNLDFNICGYYWDTWNDVLSNAELYYKNKKWSLDQDGDLWIKSEHYIYTDI